MHPEKSTLALKPYLESIRIRCQRLSKDEILDIISGIAQDIPMHKRGEFLGKIDALSKGKIEVPLSGGDILSQITDLKDTVDERIASIENGTFHEDYDAWDDYSYDEDPDALSEEQKEELEALFWQAERLFLSGQARLAREVYEALFEFFSTDSDYSVGVSEYDIDINFREQRARYCRCVYEASTSNERVKEVMQAMQIHAAMDQYHFDLSGERYLMFQDVIDAKMGELPDWEAFLPEWKKALSRKTTDRGAVLLLEAINWIDGIEGVATLARKWGASQPRGYLYWLDVLMSAEDWRGVSQRAQQALKSFKMGDFRAQVAVMLVRAGEELNEGNLILKGKRERFYSLPNDRHLIDLIEEAEKNNQRGRELHNALEVLKTQEQHTLQVKALLMAGELGDAYSKAKNSDHIGWSYGNNAGGVLLGGILAALTDCAAKAPVITNLLQRYTNIKTYSFEISEDYVTPDREDTVVSNEILKGLKGAVILPADKKKFMSWAERIGRRRIDHIVTNKYRNAYGRAAEVLGALAECWAVDGKTEKSRGIIEEFRNQKYNRFTAFKREIDQVIGNSGIL